MEKMQEMCVGGRRKGVGKGDRVGKAANKRCVLKSVITVDNWSSFLQGSCKTHFQVIATKKLAAFYTNS